MDHLHRGYTFSASVVIGGFMNVKINAAGPANDVELEDIKFNIEVWDSDERVAGTSFVATMAQIIQIRDYLADLFKRYGKKQKPI